MIRRPSRTALHSALSALSGGLRGVAVQRQQDEERKQIGLRNEREAMRDALSLADIGATAAPEDMSDPAVPTVSLGGKRYVVPTLEQREQRQADAAADRARRAAEAAGTVRETEREAANRRAFGAAQIGIPELVPTTSEYNPTVEYADLLGGRRATQPAPRSLTPGQAIAEADKERMGFGYMAEFNDPQGTTFTEDERNRFWRAFNMLQQNNQTGASDARLAYSAFQAIRAGTQQSATIDAAERAEAEARAAARREAERAARGAAFAPPPGVAPVQPDTATARAAAPAQTTPARPAAPFAPAVTPAAPARPVRPKYSEGDMDRALDALGPEAPADDVYAWLASNATPLTRVP